MHELDAAARLHGFFYAVNHGVDAALIERLASQARAFFAQDEARKLRIPMSAGGTRLARLLSRSAASSRRTGPTGRKACTSAASCRPTIRACAPA